MKLIHVYILLLVLVIAVIGCSNQKVVNQSVDVKALALQITKSITYDDELIEPSQRAIDDLYEIEFGNVADYSVWVSGSMATSNELVIIKLADPTSSKIIVDALKRRIEDQKNNYRDYNPSEMFRLDKFVILEEGPYIMFSVSDENEKIREIFNQAVR